MNKTTSDINSGAPLEARVQRLFMCQGAFAERQLFVRAAGENSNLVTDIDVLAHDYNINLHHRRIYAECKGGKNVRILDRLVWICGVKKIIDAEFAYLIVNHCDQSSLSFARSQGVEVLQISGLKALENSLWIGNSFWPGRSNISKCFVIESKIANTIKNRISEELGQWLNKAAQLWREASALSFSYGRLNVLFSILEEFQLLINRGIAENDKEMVKYALSALFVRLSQYILFAASDTLNMPKSEREKYLSVRMAIGDTGIATTRRVLDSCERMVNASLKENDVDKKIKLDIERMLKAPSYTAPFINMVERIIGEGYRATLLPLTLELCLFGYAGNEKESGGLIKRITNCLSTAAIVRAFAIQTLKIPDEYIKNTFDTPQNEKAKDSLFKGTSQKPHQE